MNGFQAVFNISVNLLVVRPGHEPNLFSPYYQYLTKKLSQEVSNYTPFQIILKNLSLRNYGKLLLTKKLLLIKISSEFTTIQNAN